MKITFNYLIFYPKPLKQLDRSLLPMEFKYSERGDYNVKVYIVDEDGENFVELRVEVSFDESGNSLKYFSITELNKQIAKRLKENPNNLKLDYIDLGSVIVFLELY